MHLHCHLPSQYTFSQYLHPLQSTTFRLLLPTFLLHLKAINRTPFFLIVENFVDNYIFFVENLWISGQNRKIIYLVFSLQYEGLSVNMLLVKMTCPRAVHLSYKSQFTRTRWNCSSSISSLIELKYQNSKLKIKNQFFKCSFATTVNYFTSYSNS